LFQKTTQVANLDCNVAATHRSRGEEAFDVGQCAQHRPVGPRAPEVDLSNEKKIYKIKLILRKKIKLFERKPP
jgi:hypothetical protein